MPEPKKEKKYPSTGAFGWLGRGLTPIGERYMKYRERGGSLGYLRWMREGKPKAIVSAQPEWLTAETQEIMGTAEYVEAKARQEAGLPLTGKVPSWRKKEAEEEEAKTAAAQEEKERLEDIDWERGFKEREFGLKERQFEAEEARRQREMLGEITPYQQQYLDLQRAQQQQARLENEAMMGWYREQAQMQQQEQERQYKSQLLANSMSWLQYSAYTGQTPTIQPWMKPLMSEQYQIGQQIPGWMGGQAGMQGEGQPMGSLPELRTPSAQLWGRMGPTAQAQYMGYGQARTGIRPEESAFRLRATAPPSGRFRGLSRMR